MSQDGGEWTADDRRRMTADGREEAHNHGMAAVGGDSGKSPQGDRPSMVVCRGVRGATTCNDNTRTAILEATTELVQRVVEVNGIQTDDIASVIFSVTPDLNAEFPAVIRTQIGWQDVALECYQEMAVPRALPKCIRILIHWNTTRGQREIEHVYLRGAENLRPDRVKPKL